MATAVNATEVHYPSEDGVPMAETPVHIRSIILLGQALEDYLRPRDPDVFIATNIFWYFVKGDTSQCASPDIMVVPGAGPGPGPGERRSFFSWREPVTTPTTVFEFASESTWEDNLSGDKFEKYQRLGVPEYFIFDPQEAYIRPALLGFRLRNGVYAPMRRSGGALVSSLGFRLRAEGEVLRLFSADDEPIRSREERAEQERQRAEQERQRADGLQSEVERLQALLKQYGHTNGTGP